MQVLLSIKPKYSGLIFSGYKKYEFRKHSFREKITKVVVYSSAPVMKVVGEFELLGVITGTPSEVWMKCKNQAGIDKSAYDNYYKGSCQAVALQIGKVLRYKEPLNLQDLLGIRPPQSFCYIKDGVFGV